MEDMPALLRQDALGANGSINLGDLLCGADQQGCPRVSDGLATPLAGFRIGASDVDGIQIKLPVRSPGYRRPASARRCASE